MTSRIAMRCLCITVCTAVALAGCKKKVPPTADASTEESRVSEPGVDTATALPFRITKVYAQQRATETAPFHADGGDRTYFDATTHGGASFTFGFAPAKESGAPLAFADVTLAAPSSAEGQKLVSEIARRFHGKDVPGHPAATLPAPKPFSAAFLATDAKKTAAGFAGTGGGYYATKLFLQRRGIEAEVFFNFNLQTKTGEFSEKDSDYADDMVAFFASELRDGPPPVRDPKTEPRMSAVGPTIRWGREIEGSFYELKPESNRLLVTRATAGGGTKVISVSLEKEGDERELFAVPHHLSGHGCAGTTCVAVDQIPKEPPMISSEDPSTVIAFDLAKKTQRELAGPWGKKVFLDESALSSDGRVVAIPVWEETKTKAPRKKMLYLADTNGERVRGPVDLGGETWHIEAFTPTRITIARGKSFDSSEHKTLLDVAVATLAVSTPRPKPLAPTGELSPDKKLRVRCSDDGATIRVTTANGDSPRTFDVFEEDRREVKGACPRWAGSRFLEYANGFIDVTTMKYTPVFPTDEERSRIEYDRGFEHAVSVNGPKLEIGIVTVPR